MTEAAPPLRIQIRRTKGWRMPGDGWKVDRTTEFGNPFRLHGPSRYSDGRVEWIVMGGNRIWGFPTKTEAQSAAVRFHATWLSEPSQERLRDRIRVRFKKMRPACWCRPEDPCHGDNIAAVALTPLECEAA